MQMIQTPIGRFLPGAWRSRSIDAAMVEIPGRRENAIDSRRSINRLEG
jgi:hypothetical protein